MPDVTEFKVITEFLQVSDSDITIMTSISQCLNIGGVRSFHFINIICLASSVTITITVLPQSPMPRPSGVTPKILTTGEDSISTSRALDKKAKTESQNSNRVGQLQNICVSVADST